VPRHRPFGQRHTLADQFVNATVEVLDATVDQEHRRFFGASHSHRRRSYKLLASRNLNDHEADET